ncbi:MAG: hypothetical protein AAF456_07970 [Planctomycetota bacterium]
MNFVGKLFTLAILILSVGFLCVAIMVSASHRNWSAIQSEHQTEANQYSALLEEARASSTAKRKILEAEKMSRAMQIAQLEALLLLEERKLISQAQSLDTEVQRARQILFASETGADLEDAETELKQKEQDIDTLTAENTDLADQISSARDRAIELTKQLNDAQARLDSRRTLAEDMRQQISGSN